MVRKKLYRPQPFKIKGTFKQENNNKIKSNDNCFALKSSSAYNCVSTIHTMISLLPLLAIADNMTQLSQSKPLEKYNNNKELSFRVVMKLF